MIIITYLGLGVFAGILAGLLGVGGGLVIVPVLLLLFTQLSFDASISMHMAVATSLAVIVLTSLSSSYAHHRRGAVQWSDVTRMTPGLLLGAVMGAWLVDWMAGELLQRLFAVFEILVGVQMWFSLRPQSGRRQASPSVLFVGGWFTAVISSLLGIGGGTISVPLLTWFGRSMRQAVATSAVCGFPIALAGSLSFVWLGMNELTLPEQTLGYVYWPAFLGIVAGSIPAAWIGAKLAHTLPVTVLKKIFAILLWVVGIRMLIS